MVEILNETRGFKISRDATMRDTFLGRFRGLMLSGRKDIVLAVEQEGILESTIHMMWMLYPIDVIWADKDMTVVDVQLDIPPFNPVKSGTWRMYKPRAAAKYVIEVAEGDVKDTRQGDKIRFN